MPSFTLTPEPVLGREKMFIASLADGRKIGFLTKYNNTRTETHPWKVFRYLGTKTYGGQVVADSQYVTCFYADAGGKKAAIAELESLWDRGDCVPVNL